MKFKNILTEAIIDNLNLPKLATEIVLDYLDYVGVHQPPPPQ